MSHVRVVHQRLLAMLVVGALAALLVTVLPPAPAAAAVGDVTLELESAGGGLLVDQVSFAPSSGIAGGTVAVRLDSSRPTVRSTQPDPAGDGAVFDVDALGWVPTDAAVRVRASDADTDLDLTVPPHALRLGPAPNVVSGRTLPSTNVTVVVDTAAGTVSRSTTSDGQGRFSVDATTGSSPRLPARWLLGTAVRVDVTGTIGGTGVRVRMTHGIVDGEVVLRDGDDTVTFRGGPADIEAFGRTTATGSERTDTGPVTPGTEVVVDGAPVALAADPAVDVTSWDPDTRTVSGVATPGVSVRVDAVVTAERFTGSVGTFATVDGDGAWSTTLSLDPGRGPFTGAVIEAVDPTPAADGASYGRERRFGDAVARRVDPVSDPAGTPPGSGTGADARAAAARSFVATILRRLPLDGAHGLSLSGLPGDGPRHELVATTDDGREHVASVDGVAVFGTVGVSLSEDDFRPTLDLSRAFDLVVTRGDGRTEVRFEPFDLDWDPDVTGFRGTVGPGQEVALRAVVPGWADADATTAEATAAGDGSVAVSLGVAAERASATVTVGDLETGRTEGGFDDPRPLAVQVGDDGGSATLGTAVSAAVAPGAPAGTMLELLPSGGIAAAVSGPVVDVRAPGDLRRVPPAPTDVAVRLATGPAIGAGDDVVVLASSTRGTRSTTTRVPGTPRLCLDPDDLPSGCDADLPTPYMVLDDVALTGALGVGLADGGAVQVTRSAGGDRVGTAVAISRATFPFPSFFGQKIVDDVVVANSGNFPDALAAAPLAEAVGAPVLLNPSDGLDPQVAQEIQRIAPSTVHLMGGPVAIGAGVEQAIRDLGVPTVARLAGGDRFETAALAATAAVDVWRAAGEDLAGRGVLVALGAHPTDQNRAWPDALAAGPLAASSRQPILLTRQDAVPAATAAAMDDLGANAVTVLGGPVAITDATADALGEGRTLRRIGGEDRYHTSTLLADEAWTYAGTRDRIWVATGAAFPDGLAASAAAATSGAMLVLSPTDDLAAAPRLTAWLDERRGETTNVLVAGGPVAVSDRVVGQLADRLE